MAEIFRAAAERLGYAPRRAIAGRRLSGVEKEKRDVLVYWVWKTGLFTNAQIGKHFGLTYSAISHSVQGIKKKLQSDKKLKYLFAHINSQYKL